MASTYAKGTQVGANASLAEIERTVERFGATGFAYGKNEDQAAVMFEAEGRRVRFRLPLPDPQDRKFTRTATGLTRKATAAKAEYDTAVREAWRALALSIKAKLAAIEAGITTFEAEFLAHVVMPDGRTVHETIAEPLNGTIESGTYRELLP